jgi:hypothetical protein
VGQRLKLRDKITGVEKGPFFGWYPADWVKLYVTGEYDYVRSSDVFDKNGREIFAGDLLSIGDNAPFKVVENVEKVGVILKAALKSSRRSLRAFVRWSAASGVFSSGAYL